MKMMRSMKAAPDGAAFARGGYTCAGTYAGLEAAAASSKEEVEEHEDKDDIEAAATVVAEARARVVAAAAHKEDQKDEENDHARWMPRASARLFRHDTSGFQPR
jgi:hypothetical protein